MKPLLSFPYLKCLVHCHRKFTVQLYYHLKVTKFSNTLNLAILYLTELAHAESINLSIDIQLT